MSQPINFDLAKDALQKLNTDDTISSAHGLLCGFYCVKQDIGLDDWLNEILVTIDLNNLIEKEAHQVLAEIFNNTSEQLSIRWWLFRHTTILTQPIFELLVRSLNFHHDER